MFGLGQFFRGQLPVRDRHAAVTDRDRLIGDRLEFIQRIQHDRGITAADPGGFVVGGLIDLLMEIEMIDVAGSVVDHEHGQAELQRMLDLLRETAIPVGADDVSADGVAVVADIADQGRETAALFHREDIDRAVKIAFGLVDIGIAPAGVGHDGAVLHPVAAHETVGIVVDSADFEFARQQVHLGPFQRADRGIGGVVERILRPFVQLLAVPAAEFRTGMGMGRGNDQAVMQFLAEFCHDPTVQFLEQLRRDAAEVEGHETERFAVGFDQDDFHIQVVIHALVRAFVEITGQTDSGRWGDDLLCITDFEHRKTSCFEFCISLKIYV